MVTLDMSEKAYRARKDVVIYHKQFNPCLGGDIAAFNDAGKKMGRLSWWQKPITKQIYISSIEVQDEYQRRGIGRLMYRELCRTAKSCGVLTVVGRTNNPKAVRARKAVFPDTRHEKSGVLMSRVKRCS